MNGRKVMRLGEKADPSCSEITVDGRPLELEPLSYIILNKPRGPITAVSDPDGRPVVMELVRDVKEHLRPAGRLDADSEGLLLLTNDGQLAHRLTHPRWGVEKVYQVELGGRLGAAALRKLREGIELEEGRTAPARVRSLGRQRGRPVIEMTLHTGWRRQVRRMVAAVGERVVSLRRVRLGPLELGNLPVGKWRRLNPVEIQALKKAVDLVEKKQA